MTRDDIIHMAKKAELHCHMNLTEHSLAIEDLEHFAALVRNDVFNKHTHLWLTRIKGAVKAEREACAKVCDELDKHRWKEYSEHHTDYGDNIRARNNT